MSHTHFELYILTNDRMIYIYGQFRTDTLRYDLVFVHFQQARRLFWMRVQQKNLDPDLYNFRHHQE